MLLSLARFGLEPNQMACVLLALSYRRRDLHQSSMSDTQLDRRARSKAVSVDRQQSKNYGVVSVQVKFTCCCCAIIQRMSPT